MRAEKKKHLEKRGWKVGTAAELLGLTAEESAYVELKLSLARELRDRRTDKGYTQQQLAALLSSSQSRVAKMEAGDGDVSLDLLIRSLFKLGATGKDLAKVFKAAA